MTAMLLDGAEKDYAWGSPTAIPAFLGRSPDPGRPLAEVWFGAHPTAPSIAHSSEGPIALDRWIEEQGERALGDLLHRRYRGLPFLVKLLAPGRPVSLQVHPGAVMAARGFDREQAAGVPIDSAARTFKDRNHKPEMVYAVTEFEGLVGARTADEAAALLHPLCDPLARRVLNALGKGMSEAMEVILSASPEEVAGLIAEARRCVTSPNDPYALVGELSRWYPRDPGAAASLLLNHVWLRPGEAVFVGAGVPHAYLSGLAVEVMANSDNVFRAGLTQKRVDLEGLMRAVDVRPHPGPLRRERLSSTVARLAPPVDEFALMEVEAGGSGLPIAGPVIAIGIAGSPVLELHDARWPLPPGGALFLGADHPAIRVVGGGRVVLAHCPAAEC